MIALQASFRTGSILAAWTDLLQTGDAYSAAEKHRARAVVRIVLASVPHLVLASFLSIEIPRANFSLGIGDVILIGEGAVQSDTQIDWLVGVR